MGEIASPPCFWTAARMPRYAPPNPRPFRSVRRAFRPRGVPSGGVAQPGANGSAHNCIDVCADGYADVYVDVYADGYADVYVDVYVHVYVYVDVNGNENGNTNADACANVSVNVNGNGNADENSNTLVDGNPPTFTDPISGRPAIHTRRRIGGAAG